MLFEKIDSGETGRRGTVGECNRMVIVPVGAILQINPSFK